MVLGIMASKEMALMGQIWGQTAILVLVMMALKGLALMGQTRGQTAILGRIMRRTNGKMMIWIVSAPQNRGQTQGKTTSVVVKDRLDIPKVPERCTTITTTTPITTTVGGM